MCEGIKKPFIARVSYPESDDIWEINKPELNLAWCSWGTNLVNIFDPKEKQGVILQGALIDNEGTSSNL